MKLPYHEIVKRTNKKDIVDYYKKGIISVVYKNSWTADVLILGNNSTVLKNIPMSSAVPSSVMAGDRCKIDMFDESNPDDIVVAYTYGRKSKASISSGSTTVLASSTAIAHNLGVVPDIVSIIVAENNFSFFVYQESLPDVTNLHLRASGGAGVKVNWYAISF